MPRKKYKITKRQIKGLMLSTVTLVLCLTDPGSKMEHDFVRTDYSVNVDKDYSITNLLNGHLNDKYTLVWNDDEITLTREEINNMTSHLQDYVMLPNGKSVLIESAPSLFPEDLYSILLGLSLYYTFKKDHTSYNSDINDVNLIKPKKGLNITIKDIRKNSKKYYNKKRH